MFNEKLGVMRPASGYVRGVCVFVVGVVGDGVRVGVQPEHEPTSHMQHHVRGGVEKRNTQRHKNGRAIVCSQLGSE